MFRHLFQRSWLFEEVRRGAEPERPVQRTLHRVALKDEAPANPEVRIDRTKVKVSEAAEMILKSVRERCS